MKSTGIVRQVDELGRIVIPKEIRDTFYINQGDSLEIFHDAKSIYLKKYTPGCTFCSNANNLRDFKGQYICKECEENMKLL